MLSDDNAQAIGTDGHLGIGTLHLKGELERLIEGVDRRHVHILDHPVIAQVGNLSLIHIFLLGEVDELAGVRIALEQLDGIVAALVGGNACRQVILDVAQNVLDGGCLLYTS